MMKIALGGPSYRMEVDARHAGAIGSLALTLRSLGMADELAFAWTHGCPVELARNRLFATVLGAGFDALFWADSDCYWPEFAHQDVAWVLHELNRTGLPFAALPCPQRNGDSNIITHRDDAGWQRLRGTIKSSRRLEKCYASGLGAAAFNLGWYRRHWPEGPHFRTEWYGGEMVSEDFWHTSRLSDIGDKPGPRYAPVTIITHAARGVTS